MVSKKEKGGSKGKGPASKRKGKPTPKRLALPPSSFSEDELHKEQRTVLDQLLAMERAHGIDQGRQHQAAAGPSGLGLQSSKQQRFMSEALNRLSLFIHSQSSLLFSN